MQHTPGPWRAGDKGLCIKTSDGYWVAELQLWGISYAKAALSDEERQANAQLIAAAPDLLAALEEARALILKQGTKGKIQATYENHMVTVRIEKALNKAKGIDR